MTGVPLSRRTALTGLLGLGTGFLMSCAPRERPVGPAAVAAAESARATTGRTQSFTLTARPTQIDLGGQVVSTWTYGGGLPGAPLRVTAGDRVKVDFRNDLPQETSVHWHGLAIRNDMDGVPHLVGAPVAAGGRFAFDFIVPDPGTYWFHPHSGLQLDRGLYAPFIVEDPHEPGGYDTEWVVVLDDWTDGLGSSPEQIMHDLERNGSSMHGMGGGMGLGGMDGGDVDYPLYLVNGRVPSDPEVLRAAAGQRIRLRLVNVAADTIFDVAVAGHSLQVTHADGYPVLPVSTSVLRLGMGERYDAIITVTDGVFALVARPVGKSGLARALVRAGSGTPPALTYRPRELDSPPLTVSDLRAGSGSALPARAPDTIQDLALSGAMGDYVWMINGRTYDQSEPLIVRQGRTTRLRIRNHSMMSHPVHVHGHTFQVGPAGGPGARKDTVLVPPMAGVEVDLLADNPGRWMVHCHNAYHAEAGMMARLDYVV